MEDPKIINFDAVNSNQYALYDHPRVHVAILDLKGNIIWANKTWIKYARNNEGDVSKIIGINYLEICGLASGAEEDDGNRIKTALEGIIKGNNKNYSLIYPCHSPNCHQWFNFMADRSGNNIYVYHVDITESLKILIKDIDVSKSGLRHDIGNSTNIINGMVSLIQGITDQPKIIEYAGIISTEMNHLNQMVDCLANTLNELSGKDKTETTYIHDNIMSIVYPLQVTLKEKNININVDCDPKLKINIRSDWFRQIITNLLTNSIKYSGTDKNIWVKAGINEINCFTFSVTDEGLGISEEDLPKIFEFRYRTNNTQNNSTVLGKGIGLFMVEKMVKSLGGSINVESFVGQGTKITITLPGWRTIK